MNAPKRVTVLSNGDRPMHVGELGEGDQIVILPAGKPHSVVTVTWTEGGADGWYEASATAQRKET